jgi:hypothetical protein
MGPPQPPSLELPKPPTDLSAKRKGDRVILTWTIPTATTDRKTIRRLGSTQICRGLTQLVECGTPVGTTATPVSPAAESSEQKIAAYYTDTLPAAIESQNPSAVIHYAIEVLNRDNRGARISNQVQVPLIPAPPPPRDFAARVTGQGIILSWVGVPGTENPQPPIHYLYRVYRRQQGAEQQVLAGEVPAAGRDHFTLTDSAFEWQKTYEYRAETVTVIAGKPDVQVEGDDTPKVTLFADDVSPPAVPGGLQAVFSGPGQEKFVDLVWAPVTDLDLDGYNIYRHEAGTAPVKINQQLVKTPAYRDASVEPGKNYFYSVSAVDLRGNQSARSEETSEAVPQ